MTKDGNSSQSPTQSANPFASPPSSAFRDSPLDSAKDVEGAFQLNTFFLRREMRMRSHVYIVSDNANEELFYVERPKRSVRKILALLAAIGTALVVIVNVALNHDDVDPTIGGLVLFSMMPLGAMIYALLSPMLLITFYADRTKRQPLLYIRQRKMFKLTFAAYSVSDPLQKVLGQYRKNYFSGLFRRTWRGYDSDGQTFVIARDDSRVPKSLRSFFSSRGGITTFEIFNARPARVVARYGTFSNRLTLPHGFMLDLRQDSDYKFDRRLGLGLGVLLYNDEP